MDAKTELSPKGELQSGHEFVPQILQGVFALQMLIHLLVLVEIGIGQREALQQMLGGQELLQVNSGIGLPSCGINLVHVDRLPGSIGTFIGTPHPINQVLAMILKERGRKRQTYAGIFHTRLYRRQFLGHEIFVGLVATDGIIEFGE